jgi:Protein of unknown function (DUF2786)
MSKTTDRIRKLRAKASDPAVTAAEAEAFNAKADEMAALPVPVDAGNAEVVRAAIAFLAEQGYRVSKPQKRRSRVEWQKGPTFVAVFGDGTTTRMGIAVTARSPFDYESGVRLSMAAWLSRHKLDPVTHGDECVTSSIVKCWFERDHVRVTDVWSAADQIAAE